MKVARGVLKLKFHEGINEHRELEMQSKVRTEAGRMIEYVPYAEQTVKPNVYYFCKVETKLHVQKGNKKKHEKIAVRIISEAL